MPKPKAKSNVTPIRARKPTAKKSGKRGRWSEKKEPPIDPTLLSGTNAPINGAESSSSNVVPITDAIAQAAAAMPDQVEHKPNGSSGDPVIASLAGPVDDSYTLDWTPDQQRAIADARTALARATFAHERSKKDAAAKKKAEDSAQIWLNELVDQAMHPTARPPLLNLAEREADQSRMEAAARTGSPDLEEHDDAGDGNSEESNTATT